MVRQTENNRWPPERFQKLLSEFFEEHEGIDMSPATRQPRRTTINELQPGLLSAVHRLSPLAKDADMAEQLEYEYSSDEQRQHLEEQKQWLIQAIVDLALIEHGDSPLLELEKLGP